MTIIIILMVVIFIRPVSIITTVQFQHYIDQQCGMHKASKYDTNIVLCPRVGVGLSICKSCVNVKNHCHMWCKDDDKYLLLLIHNVGGMRLWSD